MMKLPQPLFDVPSTQRKAKAKKKRKKSRATAVDSARSGEVRELPRDNDGVDVERAEPPATEDEPFDALWEFARQAAMPGAIVSSNVEGARELWEELGIEFHSADYPWEEDADRD